MQKLLPDFGKDIGIPDLKFDEDEYCCLFYENIALNLELDEEKDVLYLYSHIGRVPEERVKEFYEMLLKANYFCLEIDGGTLGITSDSKVVMLLNQVPFVLLDLATFETLLDN